MYAFEEAKRSKMVNFMSMAMGSRATVFLLPTLLCLWLSIDTCSDAAESDIQCLRGLKASLIDPTGYLSSWDFNNKVKGSICKFNGIVCGHPDESKVLTIRLSNMGLKGGFPLALHYCESLVGLDLSENELSGILPNDIGAIIPSVTTLDLSYNKFTGDIPDSFGNCGYLKTLKSPTQSAYRGPVKKSNTSVIIGAAIGGIVLGVILLFSFLKVSKKKKEEEVEGNKWAKSIKGTKGIKSQHTPRRYCNVHFSMFEKTVPKMRLNNLLKATQKFSENNIIRSGRAGTMYKAMLVDGSSLAIKRLHDSEYSHKEFMSEMTMLGSLKHRNVVPLLGFCIARNERLLVYKYMPKGTLFQQLHAGLMEWPLRLKIAIGVARGLAWLHHSCNPCIIHHSISSKRILLDEDYQPKISKFTSAVLMNPVDTNVSVRVNIISNNIGLVAPEYTRKIVASRAGVVYSFGVVLLELITGQKPNEAANAPKRLKGNLVKWITELKNLYLLSYAIDSSLVGMGSDNELLQFLRIAVDCIVFDPEKRPTMLVVYQLLQSIGKTYHFIDEDEIQQPQVCIDMDGLGELNMRRRIQES